jgi:hypothetical protein
MLAAHHTKAEIGVMDLTRDQQTRLCQLTDEWSIMWDKRRSLWIAAEDDPDGIQIEEADLDVLLTRAEQRT